MKSSAAEEGGGWRRFLALGRQPQEILVDEPACLFGAVEAPGGRATRQ